MKICKPNLESFLKETIHGPVYIQATTISTGDIITFEVCVSAFNALGRCIEYISLTGRCMHVFEEDKKALWLKNEQLSEGIQKTIEEAGISVLPGTIRCDSDKIYGSTFKL